MAKLKDIELQVLNILINNEKARNDDFILIFEMLKRCGLSEDTTIEEALKRHDDLDLPAFETITRCRRKIQEKYPELSNKKIEGLRAEQEIEYRQYFGHQKGETR